MFNGISVLQRQIDKKHPNNFIQLKEDETRNRTKGIALFFIEKALVKEWIYYMIEPRRQDVLEFDKDSLKYTSFPPTFYNTGDGSEIRLTAWDVENWCWMLSINSWAWWSWTPFRFEEEKHHFFWGKKTISCLHPVKNERLKSKKWVFRFVSMFFLFPRGLFGSRLIFSGVFKKREEPALGLANTWPTNDPIQLGI